jgi:hypothetical protein
MLLQLQDAASYHHMLFLDISGDSVGRPGMHAPACPLYVFLQVKNEWRLPTRTFVLLARFFYLLFVVLAFVLAFTLK